MSTVNPPTWETLPETTFDLGTGAEFGNWVEPSKTYHYPCMVCLQDGTVTATGACRGHEGPVAPPTVIELCPTCGK